MDMKQQNRLVRFGEFEVDQRAGLLKRRGQRVRLQEIPFQILAVLLEHAGEVVTREELRERLWPADTFVDFDASLNTALKKLRQALEDPADEPLYVKTVPRRGYRFIAQLEAVDVAPTTPHVLAAPEAPENLGLPKPAASPNGAKDFLRRETRAWLLGVTALSAAALLLIGFAVNRTQPTPRVRAAAGKIVLFVMPFNNLSGDPSEEYFSDGLTDEMITQVGREYPSRMAVIARTSAMQYKGVHKPLSQIAAELGGVDYVLEGSVRHSDSCMTINAQLFSVADGASLWADTYARPRADAVGIQSDVAGRIAQSLAQELLPSAAPARALASTTDPEAYDNYLRGLYELNKRTREGQRKGFEFLQRSIEQDPRFAQAYSALGYSYLISGGWGFLSPRDSFPKAKEAATKAIELDESLGDAHVTLCEVLHVYEWNWAEAEKECRRALELSPNSAMVHKMYAEYLLHAGKPQEALAEAERAQKLDPLAISVTANMGLFDLHLGHLDTATQKFKEATEIDPGYAPAHYLLGAAYYLQQKYAQAIPELELAKKLSNDGSEMSIKLVSAYFRAGRKQDAQRTLLTLQRRARSEFIPSMGFAEIYGELGDTQQTLAWLEKAAAEHDYQMMSLRSFADIKGVGDDPRFQKLVSAVAFPDEKSQLAYKPQN